MRKSDFKKVIHEMPVVMARFELLGNKYDDCCKKGNKYLYHKNGCMIPENQNSFSLSPFASNFKFIGYVIVKETYKGYEVMGEYNPSSNTP